jgi:RNA polymerase sigma-70 factor (ECF subfamily)
VPDATDTEALLASEGEERRAILGRMFETQRPRLLRMVSVRMHPRVRARVGASDVVQDGYVEILDRVDEYVADPRIPFFLWMRRIVGQRLTKAHRFHLDAQRRDARQETPAERRMPGVSTFAMADFLRDERTSPLSAAARTEARDRLVRLLDEMSETDREVLAMRHFEGLTNEEVATELGLDKDAASKRYIRALRRLKVLAERADHPPSKTPEPPAS